MIKKILVANRGEIAVRIIRACKEMGIKTVAVYSEVDRKALHVQLADEAYLIGPPAPLESYLNMGKIIDVAKKTNSDAIHPGYGFLAENPLFDKRCEDEGIIFIGSNSKALALVGDKIESRKTMTKAKIPIIPGMKSKGENLDEFLTEAENIGYPVMVKASAGGGGKGMRMIRSKDELKSSVEAGKREAKSAFGDDSVYLEKYIENPRHIEFQVVADHQGNVVHLFERECSIQRRHQKIVEETPSTALTPQLRAEMGEIATKVIKVSGYTNAGTVEFLLDKNGNYYFLEVNARIQVEHPITELTTGVDLVKTQIRIANGEKLLFTQEELSQRGHAIECRIYAEDPENDFLPSFGKILFVKEPQGPGIRNDSGLYSGLEVTMHYDPILAKLICWAENRDAARRKMICALSDYVILGIKTQMEFLKNVMEHPEFAAGSTFTDFIPKNMSDWKEVREKRKYLEPALIAVGLDLFDKSFRKPEFERKQTSFDPWLTIGKWEIGA
jgi:acetyl-CoA carboxylase biotin carboxylase subunit